MSNDKPYDEYEPNEPLTLPGGGRRALTPARPLVGKTAGQVSDAGQSSSDWTPDAWERPIQPEQSYTQRTWDEEDYPVNDVPTSAPLSEGEQPSAHVATDRRRFARAQNPYVQPTWDEAEEPTAQEEGSFVAGSDRYADTVASQRRTTANPYARPATEALDGVSDLSARFAPPLKFELPRSTHQETRDGYVDSSVAEPNVYRTRKAASHSDAAQGFDPMPRSGDYHVEADDGQSRRGRRRGHPLRKFVIVLGVVGILCAAAYVKRDWLLVQVKQLLGQKTVETAYQAVDSESTQGAGYDPAPALQLGDQASKGIQAVAGDLGLKTYAVTGSNVVTRVSTGAGRYDVYLFAASDGQLLGYYEGLDENGFLVCPNDVFYVAEPPYLINARGEALIDSGTVIRSAGKGAILGPMINGWSIISNAERTTFNYIDAKGTLLSPLWFAKAYPFTAGSTLAYVDTGNMTDPEERYSLYELARTREMKMWKHAADTNEVIGCAAGIACMNTGELIALDGAQTVLCTTDDATAYVDCGAVVARDTATGKFGLYVNGELHYDFIYDSIAPVPSEIQWTSTQNGFFKQNTVTGFSYPLPLSHYFALQKGTAQAEMVALSTASVYPLLLNNN